MPMKDGVQLKYGHQHGGKLAVPVLSIAQTIYDQSGKFVYMNDGAATLCADALGYINGFLEADSGTTSTTEAYNMIIDLSAVYRIPVNSGTYAAGMIGDTCDISIDTVQGAQLDAAAENLLIVVGGDAVDNEWVDVMISPKAIASQQGTVV